MKLTKSPPRLPNGEIDLNSLCDTELKAIARGEIEFEPSNNERTQRGKKKRARKYAIRVHSVRDAQRLIERVLKKLQSKDIDLAEARMQIYGARTYIRLNQMERSMESASARNSDPPRAE
ncbi:MAG TPA: hypothetical protein VKS81_03170 [Bacteroidota bacterium]|nr:hypothetical protein [Bacteroidota bacterium]